MMNERDETLRAAASLEQVMAGLTGEIRTLNEYGHRSRRMIWGLVVSVTLDVLLSIALGVVAVQASHASSRASAATSVAAETGRVQKSTCQSSNEARTVNRQLWNYILTESAKTDNSPKKLAQIDSFRKYIVTVFADRDCENVK